jgi:hypothetical protein
MFSFSEHQLNRIKRILRLAGLVLLIIWAWFGLTELAAEKVMSDTLRNRHREEMLKVQKALIEYEKQNSHLPGGLRKSDEDTITRTSGALLYDLLQLDIPDDMRPRMDWPLAKNGESFGLVFRGSFDNPTPDSVSLLDAWGESYHIILDTNLDGQVSNPGADRKPGWFSSYVPPATLPTQSALFSSGPDKNPSTWDDNICSWR